MMAINVKFWLKAMSGRGWKGFGKATVGFFGYDPRPSSDGRFVDGSARDLVESRETNTTGGAFEAFSVGGSILRY